MELNYLFNKNYDKIRLSALRITKNKTLANDLISETYIDIIERKKIYPIDNDGFVKWISKYLKFHFLAQYGRFRKQLHGNEELINFEIEIEEQEQEEDIPRVFSIEAFKSSLDSLDKTLFELIYERGLSYDKIIKQYRELGFEIKKHHLHNLSKELKHKIHDTRNSKLYRTDYSSLVICSRSRSDTMD